MSKSLTEELTSLRVDLIKAKIDLAKERKTLEELKNKHSTTFKAELGNGVTFEGTHSDFIDFMETLVTYSERMKL